MHESPDFVLLDEIIPGRDEPDHPVRLSVLYLTGQLKGQFSDSPHVLASNLRLVRSEEAVEFKATLTSPSYKEIKANLLFVPSKASILFAERSVDPPDASQDSQTPAEDDARQKAITLRELQSVRDEARTEAEQTLSEVRCFA